MSWLIDTIIKGGIIGSLLTHVANSMANSSCCGDPSTQLSLRVASPRLGAIHGCFVEGSMPLIVLLFCWLVLPVDQSILRLSDSGLSLPTTRTSCGLAGSAASHPIVPSRSCISYRILLTDQGDRSCSWYLRGLFLIGYGQVSSREQPLGVRDQVSPD